VDWSVLEGIEVNFDLDGINSLSIHANPVEIQGNRTKPNGFLTMQVKSGRRNEWCATALLTI
jgi:hypothetical protein